MVWLLGSQKIALETREKRLLWRPPSPVGSGDRFCAIPQVQPRFNNSTGNAVVIRVVSTHSRRSTCGRRVWINEPTDVSNTSRPSTSTKVMMVGLFGVGS